MRIVILSDTHTQHKALTVPEGDVLVHCGDFTYRGKYWETLDFAQWWGAQPHRHKVLIAGNHELEFDTPKGEQHLVKGIERSHYLEDDEITIQGVKFYGTPWQPYFYDWAFNMEEQDLYERRYQHIPKDTQVLLTHCPPLGIRDEIPRLRGEQVERVGSKALLRRVNELDQLLLHCFGHIHEGYGIIEQYRYQGMRMFVNACNCNRDYKPVNPPIVVDLQGIGSSYPTAVMVTS